jgi:hypothetical protein
MKPPEPKNAKKPVILVILLEKTSEDPPHCTVFSASPAAQLPFKKPQTYPR